MSLFCWNWVIFTSYVANGTGFYSWVFCRVHSLSKFAKFSEKLICYFFSFNWFSFFYSIDFLAITLLFNIKPPVMHSRQYYILLKVVVRCVLKVSSLCIRNLPNTKRETFAKIVQKFLLICVTEFRCLWTNMTEK